MKHVVQVQTDFGYVFNFFVTQEEAGQIIAAPAGTRINLGDAEVTDIKDDVAIWNKRTATGAKHEELKPNHLREALREMIRNKAWADC